MYFYYLIFQMTWLMDSLDPSRKQQIKAQEKAKKLLKSLGIDPAKDVKLTNYEMMVASSLGELCTSIEVCTTFNLVYFI